MKKMLKKYIMFAFLLTTIFLVSSYTVAASEEIKVFIDNQLVQFDVSPVVEDGRTLVPLRAIFQGLGATVNWDEKTSTITADKDEITIVMKIGSTTMQKNGVTYSLDVAPKLLDGRTLVPLRAVSEAFKADVGWDGETSTIKITPDIKINFSDAVFEKAVRELISKKEGSIYKSDVKNIKEFAVYIPPESKVSSIDGIEYFENLEYLSLNKQNISDISPLKALTKLTHIYLNSNEIEDISVLSELKALKDIYLRENKIKDITSLSGLSPKSVVLSNNFIVDASLLKSLDTSALERFYISYRILDSLHVIEVWTSFSEETLSQVIDKYQFEVKYTKEFADVLVGLFEKYSPSPLSEEEKISAIDGWVKITGAYQAITEGHELSDERYELSPNEYYLPIANKVESVLSRIIKPDMSDYEKALAIHNWIVNNADYDLEAVEASEYGSSAYTLLLDGKAVCFGYAVTYNLLCHTVGIESVLVYGDAFGIANVGATPTWDAHAWSIIKLDDNYYHVDATWDDPMPGGMLLHDYFLISDKTMKDDGTHRWNQKEYPTCEKDYKTSTKKAQVH